MSKAKVVWEYGKFRIVNAGKSYVVESGGKDALGNYSWSHEHSTRSGWDYDLFQTLEDMDPGL